MSLFDKILRMGEGRMVRDLERQAETVLSMEEDFAALSDEELRGKTAEFRERLAEGETLEDIKYEAFAAIREAAWRVLRMKPFKVQVMGGFCLHNGNIAEMKTGEGKTLVATMPSYLNALEGHGVHVVTVNDYLASYQSELMGRVYRFMDVSCGCLLNGQSPAERRVEYAKDITYGTNNEFGFDYLRDNMVQRAEDLVQRGHHYAIVDEVDSIMIDEARTPLIISGPAQGDADKWYSTFADLVKGLEREVDYEVDEKKRTVGILEPGITKIEDALGIDNLYEASHTPLIGFLNNAIKAKELFERDRDYIVKNREVIIVDEHTGRTMEGRRYSEGMHQAIEAKERVPIKAENQTLATITLQNYFRLYDKLAGMTGTAETEAAEFMSTYKISVIPIPTNKPMIRVDNPDAVYPTRAGKLKAIVADIAERHEAGQPILVGTTDVAKSEELSAMLSAKHIPHNVLNAKQHASEAEVVFDAGRKGAVTVATNMAGRGTDIMLGGNPEHIAEANLRATGINPDDNPEDWKAAWPAAVEVAEQSVADEHEEVKQLGGLYVLGTERHDSRRIDNQLRGRSGRQGDPGESRFYLSMEDPLMQKFASGVAQRIMASGAYPEDMPLESKMVSKAIASAQSQVEGQHFEIRKNVLKYDDVMTDQRNLVYEQRREVLEKNVNLDELIPSYLEGFIDEAVGSVTAEGLPDEWDLPGLWSMLRSVYPVSGSPEQVSADTGVDLPDKEDLCQWLVNDIEQQYSQLVTDLNENPLALEQLGEEPAAELIRRVLLSSVDRLWQEHLYEMDYLKEGIGLRAMGQRDPLVEYASEGAQMFHSMMERVREETVAGIFNFGFQFQKAAERRAEAEAQVAANAEHQAELAAAVGKVPKGAKVTKGSGNGSIMGNTGHKAASETLPAAAGVSPTGPNRAARRAQKRKKRR